MTVRESLARKSRELLYSARYFVNGHPAAYLPLAGIRHRTDPHWLIDNTTDLVIEGFARSGNTFAVEAFQMAQPRPVRIVHHTHAPALVISAIRHGIPALVIVRHPVRVALSHMVFRDISARPALVAWIRYHSRIARYRPHIVLASFESVTGDFGRVIGEINARFGTSFEEFEHSKANQARVFRVIEDRNLSKFGGEPTEASVRSIARPSLERDALKREYEAQLVEPDLGLLRERAIALYHELVGPSPEGR